MSVDEISILRAMKERLFEKGWQKGSMGGTDGPNCILGALDRIKGSDVLRVAHWKHGSTVLVVNLLDELSECSNVVTFNDNEYTTFDDIVDLIDLAIKTLENK